MSKDRLILIFSIWLAVVAAQAKSVDSGLVADIHFAGGQAVAADPNSQGLQHVWTSPEALALRTEMLDKLSRVMDVWLRRQFTPNLGGPVQWRPLLDDLCQSEWELEVREPARGAVQLDLAVRLDNARAQMWQDTLKPVCAAWKQTSTTHFAHIFRGGNWLLLQMGNVPVPPPSGAIAPLKDSWFKADINWRLLAGWFPGLAKLDLPVTHLEVAGKGGNFEVNGKLYLARPLPPLPQWQFPTNSVLGPFISFTAARGISSWLQQQPWAVATGLNPLPDQVFAWALPGQGFETYAAVPLADPIGALPRLAQAVTPVLHDINARSPLSELSLIPTNTQVTFTGMPYIAPYVKAERDGPGNLLLAGFFPNIPRGKPVPPEIMARLNEPGLVYYHWEVTSERMKLFPQLYQLLFLATWHQQLDANSGAGKWLAKLAPSLGPTLTMAYEKTPTEVDFVRKAPAGLTAVEFVAFCSWLEASNFPGCDLRLPTPVKHRHLHPKTLGTNGAPIPHH